MVDINFPQVILCLVLAVLAFSTWQGTSVVLALLWDIRPRYSESRHRSMHRAAPVLEPRRAPGPGLKGYASLLAFCVFGWLHYACGGDRS